MYFKTILFLSIGSAVFWTCKKDPGQGGNSFIRGKVYAKYYNKTFTAVLDSGYAPNVGVYIIYGNDVTYGDNQNTNYDGTYEFRYLRTGDYKIYAYSKDSTGAYNGKVNLLAPPIAVIANVTIKSANQTVNVANLQVVK